MIAGELLERLPETHLLIVGTGDDRSVREFVDDPRAKGRVTFWHRNVDLNVYGRLIDVMLDTFPFVGGNACREVAIHGKPVVSMRSVDWNRLLTKERDPVLLASSPEEYIQMVTRLVRDEHFYKECGEAARTITLERANAEKMVDDIEAGIGQAYATLRVGSRRPAMS
jgi:glycosyltransferase involved in cell wall biosynthesis